MLTLGPAPVETVSTLCFCGWAEPAAVGLVALVAWSCSLPCYRGSASQPCWGRAEYSLPSLRWPEPPEWGQLMSWQQCRQITGRAWWLHVAHVNETLPLPVAPQPTGRCDCPCAGRSVLAALGPTAKACWFLRAGPSTDPRARVGAVFECHGGHGALHLHQLSLRGLAMALWRLSSTGWEHSLGASLCLGGAGSHR